jgi:hypothetical protein
MLKIVLIISKKELVNFNILKSTKEVKEDNNIEIKEKSSVLSITDTF